ncbi:unnamed protein product [Cyclocybe aegerita]|uniref:Uncharacterized protein n=1 Tax=Cyclocybe aegerita TaxID=1973307 RepID=A0A8S0WRF3_CYCAE|nr:unnamed protein product [Cyclocybe aegerita]
MSSQDFYLVLAPCRYSPRGCKAGFAEGPRNGILRRRMSTLMSRAMPNSKDFRAFFLSRSTIASWRKVLRRLGDDIPPCPEDLTEPQYASLLFDTFCMWDISSFRNLRLQDAIKILRSFTCHGRMEKKFHGDVATTAFKIIPSYDGRAVRVSASELLPTAEFDANNHTESQTYFRPELQLAIQEIQTFWSLKAESPEEFEVFVRDRNLRATVAMNEGSAIQSWISRYKERRSKEMADQRLTRIKQEMNKLGWEEQYFPSWCDSDPGDRRKWCRFMYQTKELTDRGWSLIRPKMTAIYERRKKEQLSKVLWGQIKDRWMEYRLAHPPGVRRRMPGWAEVEKLSIIASFVSENYANCSDAAMAGLMESIVKGTEDFFASVEIDLETVLVDSARLDPGETDKDPGVSLLAMAGCVFVCDPGDILGPAVIKAFPELVEYLVDSNPLKPWSEICPKADLMLHAVVQDVLNALRLPADTTRSDVLSLGPVTCNCSHQNYRGAITFDKLVEHVYEEQRWYAEALMKSLAISNSSQELFWNTHSTSSLPSLISCCSELAEVSGNRRSPYYLDDWAQSSSSDAPCNTAPQVPSSSSGTAISDLLAKPLYCLYCYEMARIFYPLRTEEDADWHMRYKHERSRTPMDLDSQTNLEERFTFGERLALSHHWTDWMDFDNSFFKPSPGGDINFERDFGRWFADPEEQVKG